MNNINVFLKVVVYEDKPEDEDDIDEIGDIECFTARNQLNKFTKITY